MKINIYKIILLLFIITLTACNNSDSDSGADGDSNSNPSTTDNNDSNETDSNSNDTETNLNDEYGLSGVYVGQAEYKMYTTLDIAPTTFILPITIIVDNITVTVEAGPHSETTQLSSNGFQFRVQLEGENILPDHGGDCEMSISVFGSFKDDGTANGASAGSYPCKIPTNNYGGYRSYNMKPGGPFLVRKQ